MSRVKMKGEADDLREPSAAETAVQPSGDTAPAAIATTVTWDDSAMRLSYANVINIINTREEFSLFFGQNQTWDLASEKGLVVKLDSRIVMSPFAAKRLHTLLGERLASYEARFGALKLTD